MGPNSPGTYSLGPNLPGPNLPVTTIWKVFEYIPKSIPSVCPSVPWFSNELLDFVFILNLLCYLSMDLSQRALQTNEKLFQNFKLVFEIFAENREIYNQISRSEY